jgi:hypothetical protein
MAGRYPAFVFGAPLGKILPVFHFHEVSAEGLEPKLLHLAENGYRTVAADAISRFVRGGVHPGPRTVALHFDDALESLWTVAYPLLRRYGMTAVAFAIPSRISEGDAPRPPRVGDSSKENVPPGPDGGPFATWVEILEMHASGAVDVQSHTRSHAMVFCADRIAGFVTPGYARRHFLSRPLISLNGNPGYADPAFLGMPLYPQRPRMSDCLRFFDDEGTRARCMDRVRKEGGAAYFTRPGWEQELRELAGKPAGSFETTRQREKAILEELDGSRAVLSSRLGVNTVRHICFPWGIAGTTALRVLAKTGYDTAFSDRLFGMRAVRAGDDPHRLMRLRNEFIFSLPGQGRRIIPLHFRMPHAAPGRKRG